VASGENAGGRQRARDETGFVAEVFVESEEDEEEGASYKGGEDVGVIGGVGCCVDDSGEEGSGAEDEEDHSC
jgi:hypothetical protein